MAFILCEALLTLQCISDYWASLQTGNLLLRQQHRSVPLHVSRIRAILLEMKTVAKRTFSAEQMIYALICFSKKRRSPARCQGTNLALRCHLLGPKSTDRHWSQMKDGQWNSCYVNCQDKVVEHLDNLVKKVMVSAYRTIQCSAFTLIGSISVLFSNSTIRCLVMLH